MTERSFKPIILNIMILLLLVLLGGCGSRHDAEASARSLRDERENTNPQGEMSSEAPVNTTEENDPGENILSEEGSVNNTENDPAKAPDTNPAKDTENTSETDTEEAKTPAAEERETLKKYDELLKINPYVAGWLKIEGTLMDDPVVYTPGDQNYFLHRAIDGSEESKGTFFIAVNWQEGYNNTLIYGHNMKDGTAFGSLDKFADEAYGKEHHTICFDTLYEEREYELYAAFYSQIPVENLETEEDRAAAEEELKEESIAKIEEEGEEIAEEELTLKDIALSYEFGDVDIYRQQKDEDNGRFRYYFYTDLSEKEDFDYYAENVKERAIYDTGIEAEWGDEFVTLSTCSYHVENGRFVVVGIRKKTD